MMAVLTLLMAGIVEAQSLQTGPVKFSVDGGAAHQSESDLKDADGAFALDRWYVSAGVDYAWSARNSIGLTAGGGRTIYEFTQDSSFGGGEPWGKIEDYRISLTARFKISDRGTAFVIPTVRFNREKGADTGDSRSWGLFLAAAWRIRQGLTIGPGIGVFAKLDDGNRVFPVLAIDWDINEQWNLGTGRGLAASQGPGLTLSYKLSQRWRLGLSGRYEDLEFRLDDEGVAPGGIGRDQSFPLVFSGRFDASPKASFSLFAGVELGGELKLKNALGDVVDESKYDPALIIGATLTLQL